ncbi:transporter substrate-binding domain-containing protein [Rhizobium leguminosarum]|uniref:transporter substrate-binding domain-containing protein n=1 Tax=Rhizobium leguminosarum TaxID=384 RepID=UPI001C904296|nr:transporter substrate-binding domain-containing protein [Rhizobium leguminosarum]MBY2918494.1 transporter substrate-binding domain-containing protein [Rhizobium leguminosarum]
MIAFITRVAAAASLAAGVWFWSSQANAGSVLDNVLATKTLTVAVGTDWGAMASLNAQHELAGSDIDVAKGIAKYLGVDVEFVTPGWDVIVAAKWQGRWDIAMGEMTPTEERAKVFDFPAVYIYSTFVVEVHKDSTATKPSDLDGKIVGVCANCLGEFYANHTLTPNWVGAKPIKYQFTPGKVVSYGSSSNIGEDDLRLGDGVRLDAYITEESFGKSAIDRGYPFKMLSPALFSSPAAMAVLPGDKEFSGKIAAAIQSMRDDGTLSKIMIKWYGVDRSLNRSVEN